MVIKTKWEFGDTVYLKTDPEQLEYLVSGITKRLDTLVIGIRHCEDEIWVYEFEISKERDQLKSMGVNKDED